MKYIFYKDSYDSRLKYSATKQVFFSVLQTGPASEPDSIRFDWIKLNLMIFCNYYAYSYKLDHIK